MVYVHVHIRTYTLHSSLSMGGNTGPGSVCCGEDEWQLALCEGLLCYNSNMVTYPLHSSALMLCTESTVTVYQFFVTHA